MGNSFVKAVKYNNLSAVKKYIEEGEDVNSKDAKGWTPLHQASANGSYDVAKYLISKGGYVNTKSNIGGTPLHLACENGYGNVVKLLIENDADVTMKNMRDETARDWAQFKGHNNIVQLIDNAKQIRQDAEEKRRIGERTRTVEAAEKKEYDFEIASRLSLEDSKIDILGCGKSEYDTCSSQVQI